MSDRLASLLERLDHDELDEVWRHLDGDPEKRRYKALDPKQKVIKIERELRRMQGHGIGNLFRRLRRQVVAWEEIVRDLAELIGAESNGESVESVERAILERHQAEVERIQSDQKAASLNEFGAIATAATKTLWSRFDTYKRTPHLAAIRPLQGPDYREIVPAVLFILSAVGLHDLVDGLPAGEAR